jgi:hypothetical protein
VPNGLVSVGLFAEVEGQLNALPDPLIDIQASKVSEESEIFADDESYVSLEGIVTSYVSDAEFYLMGVRVDASSAQFEPAGAVLAAGMEVEVEGPRENGVIKAIEVELESAEVKISANVVDVNTVLKTVTLGFFNNDLLVYVDAKTGYDDDTGVIDKYDLSKVTAGDFLEINALLNSNGDVVAKEVKRTSTVPSTEDELLQGPVDSCIAAGNVTILGVPFLMDDSGNDATEYQDVDESTINNSADFCIAWAANPDLYVKVVDAFASDGAADEAELED